jgi:hypothetical protein
LSPGLGLNASFTHSHRVSSQPQNAKIEKFDTKRNFTSKPTCSVCEGTSDLSNDTKKHTTKFRKTIPLRRGLAARLQNHRETLHKIKNKNYGKIKH